MVTGGAGFIGSHFVLHILKEYEDVNVINFDVLTYAANLSNLKHVENNKRYKFIKGDIRDYDAVYHVINNNKIDYIINFAAESHVDRSIKSADVFAETNIIGTLTLLQAAKESWRTELSNKRYIQISTDEVYGSADFNEEFDENSKLNPGNPYSASKASADLMCMAWNNTYNFPVSITRSSNNFGSFQYEEKFIPQVIKNALYGNPIPIYGDGQNVRDWIYAEDNVRAIEKVVFNGKAGEIYNISTKNEYKNIEIAKKIINIINCETNSKIKDDLLTFIEDRKGHDFKYSISASKIKRELGWKPENDFNNYLRDTVLWYIEKYNNMP